MIYSKQISEQLQILDKLQSAFEDSIAHIKQIDIEHISTFREREPVDAFLDRFERLVDFSFKSLFRTYFYIENLQHPASLAELISFFVKKWLVDDEKFLINLKLLRNRLAHEYIWLWISHTEEFIQDVLQNYLEFKPVLENVKTNLQSFVKD